MKKIKKSTQVVCIAKLTVKQDKLDEVLQIFTELKHLSMQEPRCIRYELHQNQENPLIFTFVDKFEDDNAFTLHCEQPHIIKYFDSVLPNLTDDIEITIHNEINL